MCLRFFDSVIYELFLDKRAATRLLAFQLLSLGSFQARGSKSARKTNTGAGRENGARGFYYLKRARERANGVLLSRETSGPNSSVKTALRDSRLAKDFRKRVHHDSLEQNFEFPRDRIEEKVPPRFWRFRGFQFISFSPLRIRILNKIVIEIYNLEWKERKLATRSRSKKRASCLFKLSTNWTNVHEYPGNEWRNSIPPWNWVLLVRPLISTGAKMAGVPRVLAPWCISSNADRNRPRYDFAVYSSGISPWNLWRVLHWREKLARFIGARDTEGRIIDRNTVFIRSRDDDGGFRSDECQLCWPVETRYSLLPFMDGVGMLSPRSFNNTDNIESILHGGHNAIRMWVTRTTFLEEFSFATAIFLLLLSFSCKSLLKYCFGRAYKMIDIGTL